MKRWLLLVPLTLAIIGCRLGSPRSTPTPDVSAMVNATLTAVAAQSTPRPMATVPPNIPPDSDYIPPMGGISGRLSYPASGIPAMRVAAFDVKTGETSYTDTAPGQDTYFLELPVGAYNVVAYSLPGGGLPGGLAGGYSQAVPCGLSVDCTDHSLIPVTVAVGVTTENVDPGDWYAPEGSFPAMPEP
jgi:hypothetical protein